MSTLTKVKELMVSVKYLLCKYPILDILAIGLLVGRGAYLWSKSQLCEHMYSTDRTLALTAISTEIQAGITGTSIILAAIGALGLRKNFKTLTDESIQHFRWALIFSISSLIVGVFNLGTLPTIINTKNVAQDPQTAITTTAQIWLMVFAAIRTACGIWKTMKP